MSDEEKTEEPTPKKLADAEKKGDMPVSMEFKTWFLFLVATLALAGGAGMFVSGIFRPMQDYVSTVYMVGDDPLSVLSAVMTLVWQVFIVMMFPFALFMIAGLLGNMLQHKTVFTLEKVKPNFSKINPLKGLKQKFSMTTLVEAAKTLGKLASVVIVVLLIVYPQREQIAAILFMDLLDVLALLYEVIVQLFLGVLIILTFIAALDFAWQKYSFMKKMKMTKQEVKDERKQADGDPMVKGRIRAIRQERARQRMMAAVPDADVVITNPTHFSIALKYEHGTMDVPTLVAKGVDDVAMKIREIATEHGVPLVENPPLARALYATVDVDEEIPPDHYKAVAEVIGYVMKLKKAGLGGRRS